MKPHSLLVVLVALSLPSLGGAADAKKAAPKVPTAQGTLVDMTKDKLKAVGTITVQVNGNPMTFQVSERTRFEFFNGVNRWGANFLAEHKGKQVAVFARPNSNPAEAALVRILLPPPKPPGPPKPAWVFGIVSELAGGHVTVKLPNLTPPPPVLGEVINVTLDDNTGIGTLTVKGKGKPLTFQVNSATAFVKLGAKHKHWAKTFLSLTEGERVKVFPRYGAPKLAATVDILLKGAKAPPAIHYKDTFVTFQLKPATKYEVVRDGKHRAAALAALAVGEKVGVLPDGVHSHGAGTVQMQAPGAIHGKLLGAGGSSLQVKVHHPASKGKPASEQDLTVSLTGATGFQLVEGKSHKPAAASALKPGQHLVILPALAPPHAADLVLIHPKKGHPVSISGTVVSAGGGALTVKTPEGAVKTFTVDDRTRLEAHEGDKPRAATGKDLVAGRSVVVVAWSEPPHRAQHVKVHVPDKVKVPVPPPQKPKPKDKHKSKPKTNADAKK
jgi:hypothetical protein